MQFFYVLIDGVKWKLASKLATGNEKHEKRINYIFNVWVKDNIFKELRIDKTQRYINNTDIKLLIIDSTDVMNGNCNKKELNKSWKLHKQATKASFIIDEERIPLVYSLEKPSVNDSKAGYNLILNNNIKKTKKIFISADKGYVMKQEDKETIKKNKNIIIITPKKQYKKKIYKTTNYESKIKTIRHSKDMKIALQKRIYVEHFNSIFHRSYKRLDKIFDKSLLTFSAFIDIALSVIIERKLQNV